MLDEITQLKIEIDKCYESKDYINKEISKILDLLLKLINSDVFFDEKREIFLELIKIEDILNELFEFLDKIKNIKDIWKDYNFWLLNNTFIFFLRNIVEYFDSKVFVKLKFKIEEIWNEIQKKIKKSNITFNFDFILGLSFLVFKDKNDLLLFFEDLKKKWQNTKDEIFIQELIEFLSIEKFNIGILTFIENTLEFKICISLLILKFGKKLELDLIKNIHQSIITDFWKKIIELSKNYEIGSYIRDWLCLKLILIRINKEIKIYETYKRDELDFFSLSPRNFERLIFWIFKKNDAWKDVQWRGASGSEKGKDILAVKKENNKYWIIQAKREQKFSVSNFEKEFQKVLPELNNYKCEGYSLFLAKTASDKLFKCGENLHKKYTYKIEIKDKGDIDYIVKNNPIILYEFFNFPLKQ